MPRKMTDDNFRKEQWAHRYDSHIAPINLLVEELRSDDEWMPYVAPMYGGINARLLSVLRDPGPKTQEGSGSSFLCMENDDPTAERICDLFTHHRIGACDVVPWNIYPWYINKKPTSREIDKGITALLKLINLMPNLEVVMLHGNDAQKGWGKFQVSFPDYFDNEVHVIKTFHTSPLAFIHKDPAVRCERLKHLENSFAQAATYLSR